MLKGVRATQVLLAVRLVSAAANLVHDCDEAFNFWEPLHYALYGTGLQTWEWGARFALRSWLHIGAHAAVASPIAAAARLVLGPGGAAKRAVFYAMRALLGAGSAAADAGLYAALQWRFSPGRLSSVTLVFLVASSGTFGASTAFLPGTLSMCLTTATAACLLINAPASAAAFGAAGALLGWPFAALASLPLGLWALVTSPPWRPLCAAMVVATTLAPASAIADRLTYGRWAWSLPNLLRYNIAGGGSELYGTEAAGFYARAVALAFPVALPLAALAPVMELCAAVSSPRSPRWVALVTLVAPVHLWLAFLSCLPHKEERFAHIVYPLLCASAGLGWDATCEMMGGAPPRGRGVMPTRGRGGAAASALTVAMAATACALGALRTTALVMHYGAPAVVYAALPEAGGGIVPRVVCVRDEWHRYPSSFFLPPGHQLAFLRGEFRGALPAQFVGAAATPPQLNDRNAADDRQWAHDAGTCTYIVTLLPVGTPDARPGKTLRDVDGVAGPWAVVVSRPFLDAATSPMLARLLPAWPRGALGGVHRQYVLLRRKG